MSSQPNDAVEVAKRMAAALDAAHCEYALGGALALGFWSEPRGTLHVDLTLFISPSKPSRCVRLLQNTGCSVWADAAIQSLTEHGFCQVECGSRRIDVFLPTISFYDEARLRRKRVVLSGQPIMIWDAESLCVFKMVFFRRKDVADAEQLLRLQGDQLDTDWVLRQLTSIFGQRDPRVAQWQELVHESRRQP